MTDKRQGIRTKSWLEQVTEAKHGAPVEELLRRHYVKGGLTQDEVADLLGVGRETVIRWMGAYGIPTRDRRRIAA
jgi:DNA-binding XRE family transcriptional regulator